MPTPNTVATYTLDQFAGPWELARPYGETGLYIQNAQTELVCKLLGDHAARDARLIAAAPELLAACRCVRWKWLAGLPVDEVMKLVNDAIKKATQDVNAPVGES